MKTSLVKDVPMEFGFHYGLQIPLWVESVFVNHLSSNGVKMSLFMCQRQNDSQWASYIILTQRSSYGLEYSLIVAKKSKAWEKLLEYNWGTMKNIAQQGRQKHSFFLSTALNSHQWDIHCHLCNPTLKVLMQRQWITNHLIYHHVLFCFPKCRWTFVNEKIILHIW